MHTVTKWGVFIAFFRAAAFIEADAFPRNKSSDWEMILSEFQPR
jgi:hypothetical protein